MNTRGTCRNLLKTVSKPVKKLNKPTPITVLSSETSQDLLKRRNPDKNWTMTFAVANKLKKVIDDEKERCIESDTTTESDDSEADGKVGKTTGKPTSSKKKAAKILPSETATTEWKTELKQAFSKVDLNSTPKYFEGVADMTVEAQERLAKLVPILMRKNYQPYWTMKKKSHKKTRWTKKKKQRLEDIFNARRPAAGGDNDHDEATVIAQPYGVASRPVGILNGDDSDEETFIKQPYGVAARPAAVLDPELED